LVVALAELQLTRPVQLRPAPANQVTHREARRRQAIWRRPSTCAGAAGRLLEAGAEVFVTVPSWIFPPCFRHINWITHVRYSISCLPYDFTLSGENVEVAKMLKSRSSRLKIHRTRQLLLGLVLVCAGSILLVSCSTVLSEMPSQVGGLPAGAPERPPVAPEYPAVHEMPAPRATAVLTEEEKKKVEAELAAMRAAQARRAKASAEPE